MSLYLCVLSTPTYMLILFLHVQPSAGASLSSKHSELATPTQVQQEERPDGVIACQLITIITGHMTIIQWDPIGGKPE